MSDSVEPGKRRGIDSIKILCQEWFGGLFGGILAMVVGACLYLTPAGKALENWSYDLPFDWRPPHRVDGVAVIRLTESCFEALGASPSDFNRTNHALLLDHLQTAKMVVFDVLFIDRGKPTNNADLLFAEAIRNHGRVVLGAQYDYDDQTHVGKLTGPPIPLFEEAAAGWGVAKLDQEADSSVRRIHPGPATYPSLAWRAAELLDLPAARQPENRLNERWLNYYGEHPFLLTNFAAVALGSKAGNAITFSNKVVFVGSGGDVAGFFGEAKETCRWPWTWRGHGLHALLEVHALTFANLWRQDWLERLPPVLEFFIIALIGGLYGYGLTLFRPMWAAGITVVSMTVIFGVSFLMLQLSGTWFPWLIPVAAQLPLALAWAVLFQSIKSYIETRFLKNSLALYLSPELVKQILKNPKLLEPGAVRKEVTILFSDIEGFSKNCELKEPEEIVELLNRYYQTAIECIHKTNGTVMELVGDAILAVWNAPQEQPDHQLLACTSALLLNRKLAEFDKEQDRKWRTRVGLHSGSACVGNIGSSSHFDYTVVGEAINLASRLEGLNKQLGTDILVTGQVRWKCRDRMVSRRVGVFRFKGFIDVVEVHEIIGTIDQAEKSKPWREAFAKAMRHFCQREFIEAQAAFKQTIQIRQEACDAGGSDDAAAKKPDGPSSFYLGWIKDYPATPLPAGWEGEVDLREK